MWPTCQNSDGENYELKLREMEMESYSKLLDVFRAKGNLSTERRKLLKQISSFLNIPPERHRAEVRRVSNDNLLAKMSLRLTGKDWTLDWFEEGKRSVPVPIRFPKASVCTPLADYIATLAALGVKNIDSKFNPVSEISSSLCKEESTHNIKEYLDLKQDWEKVLKKYSQFKKTSELKNASVQTLKKKVIKSDCSYCKRRKEMKKKKQILNQLKKVSCKSGPQEVVKNTDHELLAAKCVVDKSCLEVKENELLNLNSKKKVMIENACELGDDCDSTTATIIAQEVEVETEPYPYPGSSKDLSQENSKTEVVETSSCLLQLSPSDNTPTLDPCLQEDIDPDVQRLIFSLMEPEPLAPSLFSQTTDADKEERVKRKIIESENEVGDESWVEYCGQDMGARPKRQRQSPGPSWKVDDEAADKSHSSREDEHTHNEIVNLPEDASQSHLAPQPPPVFPQPLPKTDKLVSLVQTDAARHNYSLQPQHAPQKQSHKVFKGTEGVPQLKIIKIFNGEKKFHGTIHLKNSSVKEFISRLPNARVTPLVTQKGSEDKPIPVFKANSNILQGNHILINKNLCEESVIDIASHPLINGYEDNLRSKENCHTSGLMD